MRVLWLEITEPSGYNNKSKYGGGWQDALEEVVRGNEFIDLHVAFESTVYTEDRQINGVVYHPIKTHYSWWEKKKKQWDYNVYVKKLIPKTLEIINKVQPDIIHVFGNEWPFGLVAEHVNIPVVIHIQGSLVPYMNAKFPPGYNRYTMLKHAGLNIMRYWREWKNARLEKGNLEMEKRTWKCVRHYMGRTIWDRALVNCLSPNATYHLVNEALRPIFLSTSKKWTLNTNNNKIRLFTTGMGTFWKGPDMLLKTARILKENGFNFEWNVAGYLDKVCKEVVENKEKLTFEDNNIKILGFCKPQDIIDNLCNSTIYVHTAYIENSPNSICEAQYLGVPIISTHVGGIETLLDRGKDGILVPANDPWLMADAIMRLTKDITLMRQYGENGYNHAHKRHAPSNIRHELLKCYNDILNKDICCN